MKRTPEGKVKLLVKEIIGAYKPHVFSHWPVLNGMGTPTLDCTGCADGDYFAVETKIENVTLTLRQTRTREEMREAGGTVFVIQGEDSLQLGEFEAWLHHRVMRKLARLQRSNIRVSNEQI